MSRFLWLVWISFVSSTVAAEPAGGILAGEAVQVVLPPIYQRFAPRALPTSSDKELTPEELQGSGPVTEEVPDFQRHVSPLLGRLGCNGRACHGSFQGQGGFGLSLFGYDFVADYKALLEDGAARVDLEDKLESFVLTKPVSAEDHGGGERFAVGSWEYWVLRKWIEADAPFDTQEVQHLEHLHVSPAELWFGEAGGQQEVRVVAEWADGSREDVTALCRFHSNDDAIADVNAEGLVTGGEAGDTHVVVSYDNAVVPILALRPVTSDSGKLQLVQTEARTEVDRHIAVKLQKLGMRPSALCTDEEFLRRASLDAIGTLPSAAEVLAFTADESADKRQQKVEELLERPGYAAQWTTFLCDITGNNDDQLRNFLPQSVRVENQWYQWVLKRVRDNVPYDQLVEGIVTANSRQPDESYVEYCEVMSELCRDSSGAGFAERPGLVHYWARNNFRTAEEQAIGFAYSFLGVRIQCAQCHKHPFDQWSKQDFEQFQGLFGAVQARQNTLAPDSKRSFAKMLTSLDVDRELKGNLLRRELSKLLVDGETIPFPELTVNTQSAANRRAKAKGRGKPVEPPKAKLLGGEWVELDGSDAREQLMAWLRSEENPYFSKAFANRVWAQYFGVGIVDPPDDLSLANAPSNGPLLEHLASGFRESGFDMKWLHREILNSDAYQRSWQPNESNAEDRHNFSHSLLRRLPAEATHDAVRTALANDALGKKVAELEMPRALTVAGASPRSLAKTDSTSYTLSVFGRSVRESNCDCDRSSESSLLQTVFLLNDTAVHEWLEDPATSWAAAVARKYGWQITGAGPANAARQERFEKLIESFGKQMDRMQQQMQQARARGQQQQVKLLRERRDALMGKAEQIAKRNGLEDELERVLASSTVEIPERGQPKPVNAAITDEQAEWIVENAYLRTVSRQPKPEEQSVAMNFLRTGDDPVEAVQSLMWSLVNTKEFILNH